MVRCIFDPASPGYLKDREHRVYPLHYQSTLLTACFNLHDALQCGAGGILLGIIEGKVRRYSSTNNLHEQQRPSCSKGDYATRSTSRMLQVVRYRPLRKQIVLEDDQLEGAHHTSL